MPIPLSQRVLQTRASDTLILSTIANQLKAAGKPIINLTVGEPDFLTPEFIRQAAIQALSEARFSQYTAVDGTPSLKAAIIEKLKRDNQLTYQANQIIVSTGAKQAIYNLMQALLNPGDEVILPAPYWVSYPSMVSLSLARSVIINASAEQQFKITPAQLEQAITPKTRLLILNSPANPTGAVYSRFELQDLGEVLEAHPHVNILSDDIYEPIFWAKTPFSNILQACPSLYNQTVVVNGVSKAYAMTGWRIGYAAGPAEIIKAMATIQSQSTSCPNALAQFAAEVALTSDQHCVSEMCATYQNRHQAMLTGLNQISGMDCLAAEGAFYSFPSIQSLLSPNTWTTDEDLARYLLETAHLATVPGTSFGMPGHLRLSFAVNLDTIKDALNRLARALSA